ncbi:hypothetical protein SLEP1_g12792 [Rubroshorea leprosula]|uniref:SAM domain-containing protein n=1 Tax=Rubroshorea leprosula TaxID=152421 RepID=A0AAV5IMF7_9ROSI|nr:hypothetical protein SLEP1_g12792 [Rubroshorea leprosula]
MASKPVASQFLSLNHRGCDDDDDDFQVPPTQISSLLPPASGRLLTTASQKNPLKRCNNIHRPSKKPKRRANPGKENTVPDAQRTGSDDLHWLDECCSLESIPSSIDCSFGKVQDGYFDSVGSDEKKELVKINQGYICNSIESRLMRPRLECEPDVGNGSRNEDFGEESELDALLQLCNEVEEQEINSNGNERNGSGHGLVQCPLCGVDISALSEEQQQVHTNDCLDKAENPVQEGIVLNEEEPPYPSEVVNDSLKSTRQVDVSPVITWLSDLGLDRYAEAFVREEIDWDSLKWLTEEDLFNMGVTTLGPRKKIVHALGELRKGCSIPDKTLVEHACGENGSGKSNRVERLGNASNNADAETSKLAANKLITDYFPGNSANKNKVCTAAIEQHSSGKNDSGSRRKQVRKNHNKNGKLKEIPSWCCIPGTPFRVDAFKYLRGDCSHWFLTHFHMDHYQGLTRSFCHGKIYCSLITAKLVNTKIGITWDRLQVLPLNQKISIAGTDVLCLDANHCPGSIMILFEPPNGKAVLHTGDFRFSEEMASMSIWHMHPIHTLILDTTYCNPQYDFPKQEAVIQFVIEAIQAEAFNPKTLFLIGSYTIGKERLFLEVARVLRRKVYVTATKLRLLECLGFSKEDMQWFTYNEQDSHIHVVPMWTLASFKRLKHISNQYAGRFSLIVAFSPTGWTFGKGKGKKSPGRRWQQGTIIRYEVPYSEHCSFTELREFVKLVSPETIIPSVNNDGPDSASSMVSLLQY